MKTILISILIILFTSSHAQTTDIIYLPSEKTVIGSLKYNFSPIGLYAGGYVTTSFPQPLVYTTPISIMNRVGLNFVGSKGRWGVMLGAKLENYADRVEAKPDFWFNFYPLRTLLKTPRGFDFVFSLNHQTKLTYGLGLSIPFGGIY